MRPAHEGNPAVQMSPAELITSQEVTCKLIIDNGMHLRVCRWCAKFGAIK